MDILFISSIEKIVFAACKKVYEFADDKAEVWLKAKFSIKKYYENLIEDLNVVHVHRSENIYILERIYVEVRLLKTILSERYFLDSGTFKTQDYPYLRSAKQMIRKETVKETDICTKNELFKNYSKAIILGSPGSGKSALLKHAAISILKSNKPKQIPIFIPLRDITYIKDGLLKYICKSFDQYGIENPEQLIIELLKEGKLVLFLDGLDEIPNKILLDRVEEINNFSKKYKKNKFYITSRIDSYEGQFSGFKEFEIDAFDEGQVEEFISKWFENSKINNKDLLHHIQSLPQISELTNSPLLLSLICIVFERDLFIPSRRTTLYKRCLECLIRDWDAQRNFRRESEYTKFDEEKKISLLAHIAYKLHSDNKIYFQQSDIYKYVEEIIEKFGIEVSEVRKLINEIKSHTGIITQVSKDFMSFSHLTLQEYLTAKYLCDTNKLFAILDEKIASQFWQEIFVLCASILPDASEYLRSIVNKEKDNLGNLILAAHCLSVDPISDRDLKEHVVSQVIFFYFNSTKEVKERCLQAIIRIDNTFVGQKILDRLGTNRFFLENKRGAN